MRTQSVRATWGQHRLGLEGSGRQDGGAGYVEEVGLGQVVGKSEEVDVKAGRRWV